MKIPGIYKIVIILTAVLIVMTFIYSLIPDRSKTSDELTKVTHTEGNISRTDYFDEQGRLTYNSKEYYATVIKTLDSNGKVIEERYYDEQGEATAASAGQYGVLYSYDDQGRITEYTYIGEDGLPVMLTSGYATVRRFYADNIVTDYYYDIDGKQTALTSGPWGLIKEYDSEGRNCKTTFIDAEGNPIISNMGYCIILREYRPDGLTDIEWYCDESSKPVNIGRGVYGRKSVITNGSITDWVYINKNGQTLIQFTRIISDSPVLVEFIAVALVILSVILSRELNAVILCGYVLAVLYITLFIRRSNGSKLNLTPLLSYVQLFDLKHKNPHSLYNIWLFVPIGAMLRSIGEKRRMLLLALGLTLTIEAIQYVFALGLCEFDDIFGNSLGAVIGWVCCDALHRKNALNSVKKYFIKA